MNSAVQSACITFGQLLTASMAAYAFAKLEFRGREVLFYIVLATMMIPIHVTMIPLFVTMSKLGWDNTYQGLIIPFLANAFSIFLLRQFFMTVPQDLEDAAIIDGCSKARFLFRILIPVSRTGLAAAGIFTFVHHWNTYMWPLLITSSNRMRTVQIGLAMFVEREAGTDFGRLMAASVIVALPTIIAFLMGQKEFIEGITMTGIKG
ncbi:MAG: carbohydrate ABC transporter permease [Firmicutes bacterium]|nr:carbohydrate ABC transporter permease [Bacillota bacterium]